jgi:NAD(P)H-flavin reductase/predicted pyridoxine 5'-phosphate oxidase superfamily flavin-nucleotide-binding protein
MPHARKEDQKADQKDTTSPFHAGERQVQARLGVTDIEDWARKVVRPYMPDDHREFHTALPFLVAAARDEEDRPWVTLLAGDDGVVGSPDEGPLVIDAKPAQGDALGDAFTAGADIGILGIELATRRRNRVNGRIEADSTTAIILAVDQSLGNYPQYIRERNWHRVEGETPGSVLRSDALTDDQRDRIAAADTFFIASGHRDDGEHPAFGMDASHRGGDRGFVTVENATRIVFPDFAGNNHYNTVGNLTIDPRVGLLFVDFESGGLLQLTGRADIDWGSEAVAAIPGARRLVTIDIDAVVELPGAVALRRDADSVRPLRLIDKVRESADVTSFIFAARDGGPFPPFEAVQHLPIELDVPDLEEPVRRTYSLSSAPGDERLRISVKREPEGLASNHLHDRVEPGDFVNARKPVGIFGLPCGECPVVLVSAGIGVTPMISMLHALASKNDADAAPVWFVHGARDGDHHALAKEVRDLASDRQSVRIHVAYNQPRSEDR